MNGWDAPRQHLEEDEDGGCARREHVYAWARRDACNQAEVSTIVMKKGNENELTATHTYNVANGGGRDPDSLRPRPIDVVPKPFRSASSAPQE